MEHLKVTQAGLVALVTMIVGQVIAFVPSLAADKQILISVAATVIGAAFVLANAVHHLASANVSAQEVKTGAANLVKSEVQKVNFNALVNEAVASHGLTDLEIRVKADVNAEVRSVLKELAGGVAPSAPAPPA